jgi:hypothetical protein
MKEGTVKGIQVAANVAIIVTAVLLCAVLIKNYIIAKPGLSDASVAKADNVGGRANLTTRPLADAQIQPGTKINLSGVDWAKNGQTLLLAVSDKCHFCSESAPFYQQLVKVHPRAQLVAVLPQTVEEGKEYLNSLNVRVDDIKQVTFNTLGVRGTPTLILVDSEGVAVKSWIGKLAANQEADVISSLQ